MTTDPTPEFAKLVELLADGEWHDGEKIVREAMRAVPPGAAWRLAEKARRNVVGDAPRKRPRTTAQIIESGKRAAVMKRLRNKPPRFEIDRSVDPWRIRMLPFRDHRRAQ